MIISSKEFRDYQKQNRLWILIENSVRIHCIPPPQPGPLHSIQQNI